MMAHRFLVLVPRRCPQLVHKTIPRLAQRNINLSLIPPFVRWHSSSGNSTTTPVENGGDQPLPADNNDPENSSTSPQDPDATIDPDASIDRSRFTTVIEVKMPDMGSSTNKILKWHKAEGDVVRTDDVLCDIETPDFVFGMECEDDELQIMGEILVEALSGPVPVDQVICTLLHETKEKKPKAAAAAAPAAEPETKVESV